MINLSSKISAFFPKLEQFFRFSETGKGDLISSPSPPPPHTHTHTICTPSGVTSSCLRASGNTYLSIQLLKSLVIKLSKKTLFISITLLEISSFWQTLTIFKLFITFSTLSLQLQAGNFKLTRIEFALLYIGNAGILIKCFYCY